MINHREIEFKYRAVDISLETFTRFCQARNPKKYITTAGFDYFYENPRSINSEFYRFRQEPEKFAQLSFKRKLNNKNNYIRIEHNLDLNVDTREPEVRAFVAEFGFQFNMAIFKNCFVYVYENYILAYYVVYDTKLTEIGRFLEVEMDEKYPWKSEADAWDALTATEIELQPLGITTQNRVRKSLWEMYRK